MKCHFHFDKAIIGGDLNALLYSYKNSLPLIINKLYCPHLFESKKKEETSDEETEKTVNKDNDESDDNSDDSSKDFADVDFENDDKE